MFWVFFIVLATEIVVMSAAYLIYKKPSITFREETIMLIAFGCLLSTIVTLSIIWALQLVLAIHQRHSTIKTQEEFDLFADLESAVENKELKLYFQPQANLQTGNIIGMETLLRWHHPLRGLIMPSVFIPIAEKTGLIEMITEWTILQACLYNKQFLDKGYQLRVAVNISQLQFRDPLLVEHISRILLVSELPAANLELEITETAMMESIEHSIRTMMQLRSLGIILSIDDFGTGYSSLSQLDRLPIHKLKIDKAFVQGINPEDVESNVAYSIVQLGKKLNLQISVEGIENETQRNFFANLQCHEGQGYFIGEPIPAEQFLRFLNQTYKS